MIVWSSRTLENESYLDLVTILTLKLPDCPRVENWDSKSCVGYEIRSKSNPVVFCYCTSFMSNACMIHDLLIIIYSFNATSEIWTIQPFLFNSSNWRCDDYSTCPWSCTSRSQLVWKKIKHIKIALLHLLFKQFAKFLPLGFE